MKQDSTWPSVPGSRKVQGATNSRIQKLHLATHNVRTLKDQEKVRDWWNKIHFAAFPFSFCVSGILLFHELMETSLKRDIIGLEDRRRQSKHISNLNSGYMLYIKGEQQVIGGLGFLVHKRKTDKSLKSRY